MNKIIKILMIIRILHTSQNHIKLPKQFYEFCRNSAKKHYNLNKPTNLLFKTVL